MLILSAERTALSVSRHQAMGASWELGGVFYNARKGRSNCTLKGSSIFLQPFFSNGAKAWTQTDVH